MLLANTDHLPTDAVIQRWKAGKGQRAHCLGPVLKGRKRLGPMAAASLAASDPGEPGATGALSAADAIGMSLEAASSAEGTAHLSCSTILSWHPRLISI